ncbi:MAG TPA: sigma-70 family RNA polymerase sigma factor, partial [Gemmataceae bacterium]
MSQDPLQRVLGRIRTAVAPGAPGDARLLERFLAQRDEAAFAALLEGHGPMVLGVCRRVLADEHAAEDVLQATFLLLARKAGSVRKRASVASWLHGVALRLARRAGADAARSRRPDRRPRPAGSPDPLADLSGRELLGILDEELAALPERYRLPLVLCHLEGRARDEAAALLGWSVGQVKGRLERGRSLLRDRLVRRGVSLSVALS